MRPLVIDSWAMMAFFEDEPSASKIGALLWEALESDTPMMISAVNAGEIWYSTSRAYSKAHANRAIRELAALKIEIVPADWEAAREAAAFKARAKIAYADCFAAALAKLEDADLITGDTEFRQLERDIRIVWV